VEAYTLGAGFKGAPTHFTADKIVFLSRNLDQNMSKNRLFFRKKCENRRSDGGSTPKPPLTSGGWGFAPDLELLFSYIITTSKS